MGAHISLYTVFIFYRGLFEINFSYHTTPWFFCRTADEVIENNEAGHLMRTKYLGVNEGGVNTGFSCLDTPFLIEWPFTNHLENLYISKQIRQDLELSFLHENLSALVNVILKHRISLLLPLYLLLSFSLISEFDDNKVQYFSKSSQICRAELLVHVKEKNRL